MYLPPPDFITTKEAAKRSGYTSDYLARLARSGEIVGRQVGRAWLISVDSLESYLLAQEDRNTVRARALARARANEYQMARTPARHVMDILKKSVDISALPPQQISFASHAFSLAVSCVVVAGSAFLAQTTLISEFATRAGVLGEQVSIGFGEMFNDVPSHFIAQIDAVHEDATHSQERVLGELAQLSAHIAPPSLVLNNIPSTVEGLNLSFTQLALSLPRAGSTITSPHFTSARAVAPALSEPRVEVPPVFTLDDVATTIQAIIAFSHNPALIMPVIESGYRAVGTHMLALGASMRDGLATLPHTLMRADLAIGEFVIEGAHAVIGVDTVAVYNLASAGPASARVTTAFVGGLGATTLHIAVAVPSTAEALYLRVTAMPAHYAPALAHAVLTTEYAGAARFLAATMELRARYVAAINSTGEALYEGISGSRTLAVNGMRFLTYLPTAFEKASLSAFDHVVLAFDSLSTHFTGIPAVSKLAAVTSPASTVGEQVALFTYTTLNHLFDSAAHSLALLFAPAPVIVVTSPPSSKDSSSTHGSSGPAAQSSTPPMRSGSPTTIVYSNPTYLNTTTVKGVSVDLLNQSLATLRSDLTNQMTSLIRPIAGQVATNVTTIQQVNMIQDLSNLIVRNGDFRGGTFDNGRLTNGISVSATTGSFSTLTGGSLTANALTLTNQLTVGNGGTGATTFGQGWLHSSGGTNALTSSTSPTVAYLVATSTTLASQFPYASTTALSASGLTSGRVTYAGTGGILQNSTNLTFDGTNLGIGTSTPQWLLNPASSTAPQLALSAGAGFSQWAFRNAGGIFYLATTTVIGTATSTTAALSIDANGRLGIGTTSPASLLSVAGTGFFTGNVSAGNPKFTAPNASGNFQAYQTGNNVTGLVGYDSNGTYIYGIGRGINGSLELESTGSLTLSTGSGTINAGTPRLLITSTGNVGIGTTTPTWLLNPSSATASQLALSAGAGFSQWAFRNAGGIFYLATTTVTGTATSTTAALTINANGFLGVGTTSPGQVLSANGNILGAGILALTGTTGTTTLATGQGFTIGDSQFVVQQGSGNVGIGIANPFSNLELLKHSTSVPVTLTIDNRGANTTDTTTYTIGGTLFSAYRDASNPSYVAGVWAERGSASAGASSAGRLIFGAMSAGTTAYPTERMRIDENGNVGIGTTTPTWLVNPTSATASQLALSAGTGFSQWAFRNAGGVFYLATTTVAGTATSTTAALTIDANGFLGVGTTTPGATLSAAGNILGSGILNLTGTTGTTTIASGQGFTIGSSQFVLQQGSGNVGIGTAAPTGGLEVLKTVGGDAIGGSISLTRNPFTGGTTWRGGSIWSYFYSTNASGDQDTLSFGVSPDTTSLALGKVKMVLTEGGKVGIGTTSPKNALAVSGGASIGADYNFAAPTNGLIVEGNVGIGTTTPNWTLTIASTTASQLALSAGAGFSQWAFRNAGGIFYLATTTVAGTATSTVAAIVVDDNGQVYMPSLVATSTAGSAVCYGRASANPQLTGQLGQTVGTGACSASSRRFKQDINPLASGSGLAEVMALTPVSFKYTTSYLGGFADDPNWTGNFVGFIAEDVQHVDPRLVTTDAQGIPNNVQYANITSVLTKALQQMNGAYTLANPGAGATSTIASWYEGTSTPAITVDAAGDVGIGTTSPAFPYTLTVAGSVGAEGFINYSSRSLKSNISELAAGDTAAILSQIASTTIYTYNYKDERAGTPLHLGLITDSAPTEVLSANGAGVDLYKLATFTLAGVQALAAKVDGHEIRLTTLESRIAALEGGAVSVASSSPSFSISTLASALSSFGIMVEKSLAHFVKIVADNLQVGSSTHPTGITMFDKVTGSPYCFQVESGAATTTPGACADILPSEGSQTSNASSGSLTSTPAIALLGDNPLHLEVGSTFVEPGVTVAGGASYKTYINGVEQKVSSTTIDTSVPTTYIITYTAPDQSGSLVSVMRSVIVGNPDGTVTTGSTTSTPSDTTPPVVTLLGAAASNLNEGDVWKDQGASAIDDVDGDLTNHIKVSGTVDTATPGLYTLTYSATDAAGNLGSVSRVVTVVATPTTAASSPSPDTAP